MRKVSNFDTSYVDTIGEMFKGGNYTDLSLNKIHYTLKNLINVLFL